MRLAEVTRLVTGVSGLRLAADAVIDLWDRDDGAAGGDRAAARAELLERTRQLNSWYDGFAARLTGSGDVPEPLPAEDSVASGSSRLVGRDLARRRSPRARPACA